jgi:hypothetical protein
MSEFWDGWTRQFAILPGMTGPGEGIVPEDGKRSTLATEDQLRADRAAIAIAGSPAVGGEVAGIAQLWADRLSAKLVGLSTHDAARAGPAVTELAFACAQLAANSDPCRPAVSWVESPPHTWFGTSVPGGRYAADNPDTIYRHVPIDGSGTYRVEGRFVGERPASSVYQAVEDPLLPSPVPGGQVDGRDLVVEPDGTFAVTVGPEPADGRPNHLCTAGRAAQLFLRDTLGDWAAQMPPELCVRRLSGPSVAQPPRLDDLAAKAALDLRAAARQWIDFYILGVLFEPAATVAPPPVHAAGIYRSSGHFHLAPDQALVLTADPSGASYLSLVLHDVWAVTLSYWSHQTSLTGAQAAANADGRYTFVVSGADAGVHNWVDTTGNERGTFLLRWQGVPLVQPTRPSVTAAVVDVGDLRRVLPPGTTYVDAQMRAAQLRHRHLGFTRRVAMGPTTNT